MHQSVAGGSDHLVGRASDDRSANALALGSRDGVRFGAAIAATVSEELGIPVRRLGAPRIPVGYSRPLEDEARVSAEQIAAKLFSRPGRAAGEPVMEEGFTS